MDVREAIFLPTISVIAYDPAVNNGYGSVIFEEGDVMYSRNPNLPVAIDPV